MHALPPHRYEHSDASHPLSLACYAQIEASSHDASPLSTKSSLRAPDLYTSAHLSSAWSSPLTSPSHPVEIYPPQRSLSASYHSPLRRFRLSTFDFWLSTTPIPTTLRRSGSYKTSDYGLHHNRLSATRITIPSRPSYRSNPLCRSPHRHIGHGHNALNTATPLNHSHAQNNIHLYALDLLCNSHHRHAPSE